MYASWEIIKRSIHPAFPTGQLFRAKENPWFPRQGDVFFFKYYRGRSFWGTFGADGVSL